MDTNAVEQVGQDTATVIEKLQTVGVDWGLRIVAFLLVLIIGMWVAKAIKRCIVSVMEKRKVDPTLVKFLSSLIYVALQAFVIVAALEKLNVKTASFIAILGAAGLAVGLALQGSLSNFAAGVLMIIFKPIRVGDFVQAGGEMGGVVEIGIFTTVLKSPDNKRIIVPNSQVMGGAITNFNANGTRRIEIIAGISYGDDMKKAKKIISDLIAADARILKDPAPQVAVKEMADSSVNIVVRPWVKPDDYWDVFFELTEAIKEQFDANDITIPFPQRDVHIYEHKAG